MVRNKTIRGTPGERAAAEAVGRRLPPGWSASIGQGKAGARALVIAAPDGRRAELAINARKNINPRDVAGLVSEARGGNLVVIAPFLSPRSRELLAEAGASYVDATGNLRIVVDAPAVFLESQGEQRDPNRKPRALRSLKGAAAGRVVRALCDFLPPYGVRTLAQVSSTALGTVSRVVSFLENEALLVRDDKKRVTGVGWPSIIRRWARDYELQTSNRLYSYLEPRGLPALASKLRSLDRYAVTGSMAGPGIAPARLAVLFVDDADAAANAMELTPTEAGANVWLLEPYDEVVFERTQAVESFSGTNLVAVARSQVAVDLLTSPGRGPQEAEALIEKMKGNEHEWRRPP